MISVLRSRSRFYCSESVRRKKNTALVLGYVGSNYRGLQKQPEHQGVITIEQELEKALYELGCIRDSNFGYLDKIGWSRSSRTDAGVHSSGTVCSAKLLLDDNPLDQLPSKLNERLPGDIRVIAAISVPKSWRARVKNARRVYEYLIPYECLAADPDQDWRLAIKELIGPANVHNFSNTRVPRHSLTPLPFSLTQDELGRLDQAQIDALTFQRDPQLNRIVDDISVDTLNIRSPRFWRFRITGRSFAYNQIRMLIGAIVSVSANILPLDVLRAAYRGPCRVHIPVAPAGGLLLTYIHGSFPNWRAGSDVDYLTSDVEKLCDKFKHDVLYPVVAETMVADSFSSWITEQKNTRQYTNQDFDAIVKRFQDWLPIYSNSELFALRRRLTLLSTWLPETRPLPPATPVAPPNKVI